VSEAKTMFEKIWDRHAVVTTDEGETLLYVDRLVIHEASRHVFARIEREGREVRCPKQIFACADHYVPAAVSAGWRQDLRDQPGATITVDLEAQMVTAPDGTTQPFDIPPTPKMCLLQGLDDIALTERYRDDIETFEAAWRAEAPWLDPANRATNRETA